MPTTENYITQAAGDARYQALGSLGSATPATVDAGDAGTAGVSTSAARADHEHPVSITSAQLVPAAWLAAWTTFTPTLTQSGAVTKTVTRASYIQMGKTVIVHCNLAITGAGSAGTAITLGALPVAAVSGAGITGAFKYLDAGTVLYAGTTEAASTTSVVFIVSGNANALGQAPSFATANGDVLQMTVTYEAA